MLGTEDRSKTPGIRSQKKSQMMINGCYMPADSEDIDDLDYDAEVDAFADYSNAEQTNIASPKKKLINLSSLNDSSDVNLHGRNRGLAVKSELNNYSSMTLRRQPQRARSTLQGSFMHSH